MTEEKKKVAEEENQDDQEEDEEKSANLIDKANEVAARQEKANETLAKLLEKQERLRVEETLGGTTEAGSPPITQEQKEIDSAKKMLAGTGFEDVVDPPKQ